MTGRADPGDPGSGAGDEYRSRFPPQRPPGAGASDPTGEQPAWPGFKPDTFVLHRPSSQDNADGRPVLVAWGMTLPGGAAVIAMSTGQGTYLGVSGSADLAASTHQADLTWLTRAGAVPP